MDILSYLTDLCIKIINSTEKQLSEDDLIQIIIKDKLPWLYDPKLTYAVGQRAFSPQENEWFVVENVGTRFVIVRFDSGKRKGIFHNHPTRTTNIHEFITKHLKKVDRETLQNAYLLNRHKIDCLYRLEHIQNIPGILEQGIICRNQIDNFIDISDPSVQSGRHFKEVPHTEYSTLHDFVPLFFATKTPMLSKLRNSQSDIAHLHISKDVLLLPGVVFTDGNARNNSTKFFHQLEDLEKLDWQIIRASYWGSPDECIHKENRRKRSAEVLIPDRLPKHFILSISVYNENAFLRVNEIINKLGENIDVKINPQIYFPDNAGFNGNLNTINSLLESLEQDLRN